MVAAQTCPFCKSLIVPTVNAQGQLRCPLCNNTGVLATTPAPAAAPAPLGGWTAVPGAAPAQAGHPAQGYPTQGHAAPVENGPNAVASMVLGICAIVIPYIGIILGIVAIVLANKANKAIAAQPGRYAGAGMAKAGKILGIVAICLYTVVIIFAAIVFVLVSNLAAGNSGML